MRPVTRAAFLTALATANVLAFAVAQLLKAPGTVDPGEVVLIGLTVLSFVTVGAYLANRLPRNAVGWLFVAAGTMLAFGSLVGAYGQASLRADGTWPGTPFAVWLANLVYVPAIVIVVGGVPAIFPDGHLPSPRWRWLPVLLVTGTIAAVVSSAFEPGPVGDPLTIENPYALPALQPVLLALDTLTAIAAFPAFVGAFAAAATRYRRGTAVERQQLKWLLAVSLVGVVAFGTAFTFAASPVSGWAFFVGFVALAALPFAIAVAILRYRLYEIDRLVSRTIAWALVTGTVVAVFTAASIGLQAVFDQWLRGPTVAVALSTLVAFALFRPLLGRVQRVVDRRFDRARYDGERTVEAFAAHLRDRVDLGQIAGETLDTVGLTVRPSHSAIWLRGAGGRR